jgi:hypothetical protein
MLGRRRVVPLRGYYYPRRVPPGTTPPISGSIAGFMVVPHDGYDRGTTLAFGCGRTRPPLTPVGGGAGTTPNAGTAEAAIFTTMPSAGAQPAQAMRRLTLSLRITGGHTRALAAPQDGPPPRRLMPETYPTPQPPQPPQPPLRGFTMHNVLTKRVALAGCLLLMAAIFTLLLLHH